MGDQVLDLQQFVGRRVRIGAILLDGERDGTVPSRNAIQGFLRGPLPPHPDRDPGPLYRSGEQGNIVDGKVLAVVTHLFTAPESGDELEGFVEDRSPLPNGPGFVERRECAIVRIPGSDSQNQPSPGQVIERGELTCQLPGPSA